MSNNLEPTEKYKQLMIIAKLYTNTFSDDPSITTLVPCIDCTRAIISVEVKNIITFLPKGDNRWGDIFKISEKLLSEANIPCEIISITQKDLDNINLGSMGWETSKLSNATYGGRRNKTRKNKN